VDIWGYFCLTGNLLAIISTCIGELTKIHLLFGTLFNMLSLKVFKCSILIKFNCVLGENNFEWSRLFGCRSERDRL
jgi:hypothetical protein